MANVTGKSTHDIIITNIFHDKNFSEKLKMDVVNLTLILRAAGFDLNSFDFASFNNKKDDDNLTIEIRCGKSGILSKLSKGPPRVCDCPKSSEKNDSAFWEIEGVAPPKSPLQNDDKFKGRSSNLLPHISASDNLLTKNILGFLCEQYRFSTGDLNVGEMINGDIKNLSTKDVKTQLLVSPKMENQIEPDCTTPLSSLNITPTPENIDKNLSALTTGAKSILPKIYLTSENSTTPPAEGVDIGRHETKTSELEPPTQSPTPSRERDTFVIQNIIDARAKLDEILLCMKLNTSDLSGSPFSHNNQRKSINISPSPSQAKQSLTLNSVNRRMSAGHAQKPSSPIKKYIKPVGISKIAAMIKKDTPRPPKNAGTGAAAGAVPKQIGKIPPFKSASSLGISTAGANKSKK